MVLEKCVARKHVQMAFLVSRFNTNATILMPNTKPKRGESVKLMTCVMTFSYRLNNRFLIKSVF